MYSYPNLGYSILGYFFVLVKKTLHSKEYKILLQLLYQVRISANLTQQEFADMLDVPQSFISKIENGERRLDVVELWEICNVLEIDFTQFINEFENRINATK